MMRQHLAASVIFLASALAVTGCAPGGDTRIENDSFAASSSSPSQKAKTITVPFGSTASMENLEVTLLEAHFGVEGNYLSDNGQFLSITLKVKNTGSQIVDMYQAGEFTLKGSDLYLYDSVSLAGSSVSDLDFKLSPLETLKGQIVFDVPVLDSYVLKFQPSYSETVTYVFEFPKPTFH